MSQNAAASAYNCVFCNIIAYPSSVDIEIDCDEMVRLNLNGLNDNCWLDGASAPTHSRYFDRPDAG